MSLTIEKTFTLDAPVDAAWAFLTDPYRVVGCLPGAEITEKVDDRTYAGMVTVKVGPVTAGYKGRAEFVRLDRPAYEAEMVGRGQDVKGKGGVEMRMVSRLRATAPGTTVVTVTSQVGISGRLAQFGRGMIEEVSDQIFEQFAASVGEQLRTVRPAPAPAAGTPSTTSATGTGPARSGPSGQGAGPAPAVPLRVLPFALRALGRWLTRPFRRGRAA